MRAVKQRHQVHWHKGFLGEETEIQFKAELGDRSIIPIQCDGSSLWIGPITANNRSGCVFCLNKRLFARKQREYAFTSKNGQAGNMFPTSLYLETHKQMALALVRFLEEEDRPAGFFGCQAIKFNLLTGHFRKVFFLHEEHCSFCGMLNPIEECRQPSFVHKKKHDPDHLRVEPLCEMSFYDNHFVDRDVGILHSVGQELDSPIASPVICEVHTGTGLVVPVAGHKWTFNESKKVCILEAIERYCGFSPKKKVKITYDTFAHIQQPALDPKSCGLPLKPTKMLQPYQDRVEYAWIEAYSLKRNGPIMVPYQLVYYAHDEVPGEQFLSDTSSGCATGGNFEEALLHALLELVERDHFMLSWYARCRLPRLELGEVSDLETLFLLDKIEKMGAEVHLFAMKFDLPVAAVMAVVENTSGEFPSLLFAADCDYSPIRAVKGALSEVLSYFPNMDIIHGSSMDRLKQLSENLEDLDEFKDHQGLWCLPAMKKYAKFLLGSDESVPLESAFNLPPKNDCIGEDLLFLTNALINNGYDVIVSDQSSTSSRELGVHTVRAIVPGLLPMTFGQNNRRFKGMNRLKMVPYQCGYQKEPLSESAVYMVPHPFP
jgi:ribosomal protein S12 methylthiotransferase accessory factor